MFSSCKAAVFRLSCLPPKSRHSGFSQDDHNSVVGHSGVELHVMVLEGRTFSSIHLGVDLDLQWNLFCLVQHVMPHSPVNPLLDMMVLSQQ